MAHAAESTHWYDREGRPAYTVIGANGQERNTTLRDARKLGLCPSVTTVIRCADRPGLTNWMIDQAILAALTLPTIAGEATDAYLARIKRDSKEQARKAAERGTAIHAAIQGYYEGEQPPQEMLPYCHAAHVAVTGWGNGVNSLAWKAETSFAHVLGFGGKCDLSHPQGWVLDFKTKEFDESADLKTWDEHAYQLAAYRMGLGLEKARCAIVYVSTTKPGLARLIEIPEEELVKGWKCFAALLAFWQARAGYNSAFSRELAAA